jgi:hypothetical protein
MQVIFSGINMVFLAQVQPTLDKINEFVFTNTDLVDRNGEGIAKAFEDVWKIVMNGNLYSLSCSIGLLVAICAVGFWCVKFYIALDEGGYRPAANEMIFPIILVILLSNGGANMRSVTLATHNIMNNVNESVNKVVSLEIDMRQALSTIVTSEEAKDIIISMYESCTAKVNINDFGGCVQSRKVAADLLVEKTGDTIISSPNAIFRARQSLWLANVRQINTALSQILTPDQAQTSISQNSGEIPTTPPNVAAAAKTFDLFKDRLDKPEVVKAINTTISGFRRAFLYIIETMMLVSALIGPIFVALSLFPVGSKPAVSWAISFLSLGFCKICFSLISGLSAIAFVCAGPVNTDMTVVAVVLGLLAPVLSFSIASGSGLSALSNVSQISQNFGLNTGAAYYVPGQGQPDTNK